MLARFADTYAVDLGHFSNYSIKYIYVINLAFSMYGWAVKYNLAIRIA